MNNVIDSGSNIIVNATRTANIDKLGETQGFNWLTAFITIIVVLLIAFCGFCCYRREERARKEKASLEREKEQLRWLSERIEELKLNSATERPRNVPRMPKLVRMFGMDEKTFNLILYGRERESIEI